MYTGRVVPAAVSVKPPAQGDADAATGGSASTSTHAPCGVPVTRRTRVPPPGVDTVQQIGAEPASRQPSGTFSFAPVSWTASVPVAPRT